MGVRAQAYSEAPLAIHLHVSQQNTFQNLALRYQLSVQIEFLRKNYWERNVQADIQKARGFFHGLVSLRYPNIIKQTVCSQQAEDCPNAWKHCTLQSYWIRLPDEQCPHLTQQRKKKDASERKQSKETFGTAARCKFCFDTIKYILRWHQCDLCNSDFVISVCIFCPEQQSFCFRLSWFQPHSNYVLSLNMNNTTASDFAVLSQDNTAIIILITRTRLTC